MDRKTLMLKTEHDRQEKVAELVGGIASVIERSGCTYGEAMEAMERLEAAYKETAGCYLDRADIKEVSAFEQRLYEEELKAASSGQGAARLGKSH